MALPPQAVPDEPAGHHDPAAHHDAPGRDDPDAAALRRRLARLRFDLHDGPQQDVHLLAQDLGLFREQLQALLETHQDRDRVLGRIDDLQAQLESLDRDLRRLWTATQEPLPRSVSEPLFDLAQAFADRTGVVPSVGIAGEFDALTDSQRQAILSVAREALSNIRKHGHAERVEISVTAHGGDVEMVIRDDGEGFDPETVPALAAQAGHLGLVGMRERVEMLGGRFRIESGPGGPTRISVRLPRWPS